MHKKRKNYLYPGLHSLQQVKLPVYISMYVVALDQGGGHPLQPGFSILNITKIDLIYCHILYLCKFIFRKKPRCDSHQTWEK